VAPTKLISTSQGFQDPKGNVVANGILMLTLSQTATVTATGGQVTTEPIYLTLDANGKITATAIYFVDELSPSGLIYYGKVYSSNGCRIIPGLENLSYSITGASFDLATAVQSGPASPSYSGAVLLTPSTVPQVITTGDLNPGTDNSQSLGSAAKRWLGQFASILGLSGSITPNAAGGIDVGTAALPFSGIRIGAAATNNIRITGTATGAKTATLPDNTGTVAELNLAQTWTATQTFSGPIINGSPTGTGIPTITLKKGSGGGNYTSASTTYAVVDSTNLCYTVTIPTGWKLAVQVSFAAFVSTAAVAISFAITDNAACGTANSGIIADSTISPPTINIGNPLSFGTAITGDGASHSIALQFKTSNASDSVNIVNSTATNAPMMVFILTPSN
jgi:hypothetical protein